MPPERRALLIGNYLSASGYSRGFIEELAQRLEAVGWDCVRTSHLVWKPARLVDMIQTSLRRIRSVSVVHIPLYSGEAFIWAAISAQIAAMFRKPLVISLHGGNLPVFSEKWPRAVRHVLGLATTVVAPSDYLRSALRRYRSDIVLLPNPVELHKYTFRARDPIAPRLIWLRAFHKIYNPTLAPRMLAVLRQRHRDASLLMIGSDKGDGTRQATERVTRELGLTDAVTFHGVIPKLDVPLWLDKGDIFISTTDIDNTPVSVLEAMACGLPVVSTNVGGVPYLLDDGRDALLVPRDDPGSMAEAVAQLIEHPDLARAITQAARRKVESFDWDTMVWRWQETFLAAAFRQEEH